MDEFIEFESDDEEEIAYEGLDLETDYEINEINSSIDKTIYGVYHKIRAFIFYYNAEKEKVRKKADRWAAIGAIIFGFLVFVGEPEIPIDKWYVILILELACITCIFATWFKECFIIHGNIRVYYDVEIQLEEEYPFLGHPFQYMGYVLHSKIKDPNLYNGFYYIPHLIALEILAIIGIYNEVESHTEPLVLTLGIVVILATVLSILVFSKLSGSSKFQRERLFKRGEIMKILRDK